MSIQYWSERRSYVDYMLIQCCLSFDYISLKYGSERQLYFDAMSTQELIICRNNSGPVVDTIQVKASSICRYNTGMSVYNMSIIY